MAFVARRYASSQGDAPAKWKSITRNEIWSFWQTKFIYIRGLGHFVYSRNGLSLRGMANEVAPSDGCLVRRVLERLILMRGGLGGRDDAIITAKSICRRKAFECVTRYLRLAFSWSCLKYVEWVANVEFLWWAFSYYIGIVKHRLSLIRCFFPILSSWKFLSHVWWQNRVEIVGFWIIQLLILMGN